MILTDEPIKKYYDKYREYKDVSFDEVMAYVRKNMPSAFDVRKIFKTIELDYNSIVGKPIGDVIKYLQSLKKDEKILDYDDYNSAFIYTEMVDEEDSDYIKRVFNILDNNAKDIHNKREKRKKDLDKLAELKRQVAELEKKLK